ncbi:MAG TPA: glycosyltransferase family 4 protein [Vicinamibacterales bacterium]|nr:glycosyltransferase family 4 protein [Vicinamibacterales bacterium]
MRIVFLSPSGELGGAETALVDMLAAIRAARPEWTLATIAASDGPLIRKAGAYSETIVLPFPNALARLGEWGTRGSVSTRVGLGAGFVAASGPALGYARHLKRHLLDFHPDIIHSNGLKMHLLGARVQPPGAKLIWHFHDYPAARRMTAALLASQAHRCDAMLANSESVAAEARARFGAIVPLHTVYNAVDLERFAPSGPRVDLDALAGLPPLAPGGVRVGLVATFARWKGHTVFLDALAKLRMNGPPEGGPSRGVANVRGYIVGGSIYHTGASQHTLELLRAQARVRGLGDAVGFTGTVDDVPGVMRALDVVVHASIEPEPFGLVIAEAMACGRPVIVSRAGGAAEIAQGGAVFHKPGDSAELAERIRELASDPARREALGDAGRAVAMRLFSRERLCATLMPVYESLARSARS